MFQKPVFMKNLSEVLSGKNDWANVCEDLHSDNFAAGIFLEGTVPIPV